MIRVQHYQETTTVSSPKHPVAITVGYDSDGASVAESLFEHHNLIFSPMFNNVPFREIDFTLRLRPDMQPEGFSGQRMVRYQPTGGGILSVEVDTRHLHAMGTPMRRFAAFFGSDEYMPGVDYTSPDLTRLWYEMLCVLPPYVFRDPRSTMNAVTEALTMMPTLLTPEQITIFTSYALDQFTQAGYSEHGRPYCLLPDPLKARVFAHIREQTQVGLPPPEAVIRNVVNASDLIPSVRIFDEPGTPWPDPPAPPVVEDLPEPVPMRLHYDPVTREVIYGS